MISRRHFTLAALGASAAPFLSRLASAAAAPLDEGWRRFKITTRLEVPGTAGPAQAWVPLAGFNQPDWVRQEGQAWSTSANGEAVRVEANGASLLHVQWGEGTRVAEVSSTVATRDRSAPFATADAVTLSAADRAAYLQGTAEAPVTSGIIRDTAERIVAGRMGDRAKAQAIYDWVVDNTFRSAPVPGCGEGNVARMLSSGTFGGKCADINPLFVALARAAGLPARDIYGIRVAPSRLGYGSLGPSTATVTKAQHCRADVFLEGFGWTAMDPADVRKVMLEEQAGGLPMDNPRVQAARARLFGAWEGNWMPFNAANDVTLPGRSAPVNFLMYPQVDVAGRVADCYDPDHVRYTITATELAI